ncbi:MAG: hypothetical protein KF773_37910 [Deltaproteobacteria bacterium]|nr:hypothetical protein [Deltaproteobacteria bacterium]
MGHHDEQLKLVDEALRGAKGPLLICRQRHGVRGDIEFALRYGSQGELTSVTVRNGPPDMSPEFIVSATNALRATVVLPATGVPGAMSFIDLGMDSRLDARTINAAADAVRAKRSKTNPWVVVGLVLAGAVFAVAFVADDRKKRKDGSPSKGRTDESDAVEAPIDVSSDALHAEYAANEVRADQRFKGKTLRVSGAIQAIRKDILDNPIVVLWTRNQFEGVHARFNTESELARLSIGDRIIVRCIGDNVVLNSPMLKKCTLE